MTVPYWLVWIAVALAPFTVLGIAVAVRAMIVIYIVGTEIVGDR